MVRIKDKIALHSIIVVIIVSIIIGYSYLKVKDLISGPTITVAYPANGESLKQDYVNVTGKAERISQIYLNGRKIFTDEQGNFNEPLLLSEGYNIFEIKAEDQFGREIKKILQLVYNGQKNKS